jgi:hypothetical protein
MIRRLAWTVPWLLALAACSDKSQPQAGSQTHFLETCDESCPEPYACICGACTLACHNDKPCSAEVKNARCTVALSTDDAVECKSEELVCDVACQHNSDCNLLGAGYTCEASRCRATTRESTSTSSDAGANAATQTGVPVPKICDGSDDIRLGIWNTPGSFSGPADTFMTPFGYTFAFVDGHCRFYASTKARIGLVGGTLDSAEAEQLAREIGLASFSEFDGTLIQGCLDGGSTMIGDGVHAFSCMCGDCGDSAPTGMAEAVDAGQAWIMRLATEGAPWSGAIRAVAIDFMEPPYFEAPQPWPLATSIDDIWVPSADLNGDSGTVFDSAADTAALQAVRTQHNMLLVPFDYISVTAGEKKYSLYVRDELPRKTTASFTRFQTVAGNVISVALGNEPVAVDAGGP